MADCRTCFLYDGGRCYSDKVKKVSSKLVGGEAEFEGNAITVELKARCDAIGGYQNAKCFASLLANAR